jgi:flagellar motor switch protein FliN
VTDQAEKIAPVAEAVKEPVPAKPAAAAAQAVPLKVSSRLIENVGIELQAFLGSASMTVADLTGLGAGAVVALDAQLNGAVELQLNGVAVARGELVAVGDKFGVRVTEIVQWPD